MSGKIEQRMFKDIPIIGCQQRSPPIKMRVVGFSLAAFVACSHLLIGLAHCNSIASSLNGHSRANKDNSSTEAAAAKTLRPVFFSEYRLRSIIEGFNSELRSLKRDFMEQITSVYFNMKLDSEIGFEKAAKEARGGSSSASNSAIPAILMGEQFSDIVIKRYIIQRRLLAGLKVVFVKFLPVETLKRLYERFPSYSWLQGQNQIDLRPKFPNATERQFVTLYKLIELRARIRAADDVLTLTEDNIKRILSIIQAITIDQKQDSAKPLNQHAKKILDYFIKVLFGERQALQQHYQKSLEQSSSLGEHFQEGQTKLLEFIDRVIDAEALDIDLSQQATNLDFPPTINENMINNVERKWIPKSVLESVNEDRRLLLGKKEEIRYLVESSSSGQSDLLDWCKTAAGSISQQSQRRTFFY